MKLFEKIQKQPLYVKKIVFWVIIIVLGLSLLLLWLKIGQWRLENFQQEEIIEGLGIPSLEEKLGDVPESSAVESLQTLEENLQELQELAEEEQQSE